MNTNPFLNSEDLRMKKRRKTNKIILIIIGSIIAIGVIGALADGGSPNNHGKKAEQSAQAKKSDPGIGQVLKTQYFDITVNSANLSDDISTGNEVADLPKTSGYQFIILDITFKNTDTESRMIEDGEVQINYNGKDYKFDKSETIMATGWGLFLDQINPLTSKTTKLVYKIPTEVKGVAFYHPGRSDDDQVIDLGEIK